MGRRAVLFSSPDVYVCGKGDAIVGSDKGVGSLYLCPNHQTCSVRNNDSQPLYPSPHRSRGTPPRWSMGSGPSRRIARFLRSSRIAPMRGICLGAMSCQVGSHLAAADYILVRSNSTPARLLTIIALAWLSGVEEAGRSGRLLPAGPGAQAGLCRGPQQPGRCLAGPGETGRSGRLLPAGPGTQAGLSPRRTTTWASP